MAQSKVHANARPMRVGSVEFANPLNIPMERRLQTFAVIFYIFMFLVTPLLCTYYPLKIFFTTDYWW